MPDLLPDCANAADQKPVLAAANEIAAWRRVIFILVPHRKHQMSRAYGEPIQRPFASTPFATLESHLDAS